VTDTDPGDQLITDMDPTWTFSCPMKKCEMLYDEEESRSGSVIQNLWIRIQARRQIYYISTISGSATLQNIFVICQTNAIFPIRDAHNTLRKDEQIEKV
jgi:hypothetical protein